MPDFPFDHCPTAGELLAYVRGTSPSEDARGFFSQVLEHLRECADCRIALEQLRGTLGKAQETASESVAAAEASHATAPHPAATSRSEVAPTYGLARGAPTGEHTGEPARAHASVGGSASASGYPKGDREEGQGALLPPEAGRTAWEARLDESLANQRRLLAAMRTETPGRGPRAGDVWTVPKRGGAVLGGSRPAQVSGVVVIVRIFVDDWTGDLRLDAAPVTDDEWFATDWSLVLPSTQSGTGTSLVIHVDLQCTTERAVLGRWLGALPQEAGRDLMAVAHAYEREALPPVAELRVGRLGQAAIRTHPEWPDLAKQLLGFCSDLGRVESEEEEADQAPCADDLVSSPAPRRRPAERASSTPVSREPGVNSAADGTPSTRTPPTRRRHDVEEAGNDAPRSDPCTPRATAPRARTSDDADTRVSAAGTSDPNVASKAPEAHPSAVGGVPTGPYTPPVACQRGTPAPSCCESSTLPWGQAALTASAAANASRGEPLRLGTGDAVCVVYTLGELLRWYLDAQWDGDLKRWCLRTGRRVSWEELESYTTLPATVVLSPEPLPKVLNRCVGPAQRPDFGALHLLGEVAQCARLAHGSPGQVLGQRAARRQS